MQTPKAGLLQTTCSSLAVVLLLTFGGTVSNADSISDTLTVSDTLGFSMTVQLTESQEPGKVTVVFPGRILDFTNPGRTELSDILTISAISFTLFSDGDTSDAPEPPEDPAKVDPIVITAQSDQNTAGGISDTLTVSGHKPVTIPESAEPAEAKISIDSVSIPFGNGGDSLVIGAFTVDLVSLNDKPGADIGDMTDTINITATSDPTVPEPSPLSLLALGLVSAGAMNWIRIRLTHQERTVQ